MALPTNAQENVLAVLCFSPSASIVAGMVKPKLFDNEVYRTIAERAIDYVHKYKKPPRAHITDLLQKELGSKNQQRARLYGETVSNLYQLKREGFNDEYIVKSLRSFIREQRLKNGVLRSAKLLQAGNAEDAERILYEAIKSRDDAFEPGITLKNAKQVLQRLKVSLKEGSIKSGIPVLDDIGATPAAKTLFLIMAPTNKGKSWGLIHLGRQALLQHLKVLHVTLEMSEDKVLARYLQNLFSLRRRGPEQKVKFTHLEKENGVYVSRDIKKQRRASLTSRKGRRLLKRRLSSNYWASSFKLVVKEFPTSSLTVKGLESYLDYLERYSNFMPDVVIIDYPDLMEIDPRYLRVDTARIYKELRGLAVQRNLAMLAATQANRAAEDATLVTFKHVSEDYSKIMTADTVISYTQTEVESKLDLARLFVLKARDERRGEVILISQSYDTGQFCLDSAKLKRSARFLKQLEEE